MRSAQRARSVPTDRLPIIDGDIARVPLTQGRVAIIDAADVEIIGSHLWCATAVKTYFGFYAVTWASGQGVGNVQMHRLLTSAPARAYVDHINRNGLDNRRANIRICTASENCRNRRKRAGSSSRYHGVSIYSATGRWQAAVRPGADRRRVHLGMFATEREAAEARDRFIREHCPSEFWLFNFPLLPGERGIDQLEMTA